MIDVRLTAVCVERFTTKNVTTVCYCYYMILEKLSRLSVVEIPIEFVDQILAGIVITTDVAKTVTSKSSSFVCIKFCIPHVLNFKTILFHFLQGFFIEHRVTIGKLLFNLSH